MKISTGYLSLSQVLNPRNTTQSIRVEDQKKPEEDESHRPKKKQDVIQVSKNGRRVTADLDFAHLIQQRALQNKTDMASKAQ